MRRDKFSCSNCEAHVFLNQEEFLIDKSIFQNLELLGF